MTFVMIGMSACSGNMDLSGTSWGGSTSVPIDEENSLEVYTTITFSSATEGSMSFSAFGESTDQAFTYTCDSKGKGVISGTDEDDGQPMESNFEVNGDKLTIVEDGQRYEFDKL